jgi:hypothetical protein
MQKQKFDKTVIISHGHFSVFTQMFWYQKIFAQVTSAAASSNYCKGERRCLNFGTANCTGLTATISRIVLNNVNGCVLVCLDLVTVYTSFSPPPPPPPHSSSSFSSPN